MPDYTKAKVGYEDIFWDTNRNAETTNRASSTGGTVAIKHINADHIPVLSTLVWDSAETVHDFLVLTKAFKDTYDAFVVNVGHWDKFLGFFADEATLIATHSAPSSDDSFAWNNDTNSFWFWDEDLGTPAWVDYNEQIYDRTNHTGEQAISTVTGLQTALDGKASTDGDVLDITFNPSNYTPNFSGTPATDNDDLAAHLNGIDANMRKNNWTSSDPGVGDDSDDGYSIGSVWFNTSTGAVKKCTDASVGAAVWENYANTVETLLHTEEITSSVATVSFSIPSSSSYRRLRIEWDLEHVAGGTYNDLFMVLTLNGTKYTSGYKASAQGFNASSNAGANTTANIQLSSAVANTDTEQSGHVIINNEDGVQRKGYGQYCGADGNGWVGGVSAFAYTGTDETEVIDSVEFSMTNNMTGGKFRVYGVND